MAVGKTADAQDVFKDLIQRARFKDSTSYAKAFAALKAIPEDLAQELNCIATFFLTGIYELSSLDF